MVHQKSAASRLQRHHRAPELPERRIIALFWRKIKKLASRLLSCKQP